MCRVRVITFVEGVRGTVFADMTGVTMLLSLYLFISENFIAMVDCTFISGPKML